MTAVSAVQDSRTIQSDQVYEEQYDEAFCVIK